MFNKEPIFEIYKVSNGWILKLYESNNEFATGVDMMMDQLRNIKREKFSDDLVLKNEQPDPTMDDLIHDSNNESVILFFSYADLIDYLSKIPGA